MSESLDLLKAKIAAAKVAPDKVSPEWAYQRAWNDALEWVERQMAVIEKGSK